MQTGEQHIHREKANSTFVRRKYRWQIWPVLCGLSRSRRVKRIANRVHRMADIFALGCRKRWELLMTLGSIPSLLMADKASIVEAALANTNLRTDVDNALSVAFNETTTCADIAELFDIFSVKVMV